MALKMTIPYIVIVMALLAISDGGEAGVIGINWGRRSAQRLVPSQVVDLLLQNGIQHARVYSLEEDILDAFSGSGINLTVTIDNATLLASMDDARAWVQTNTPYFSRCNIRAVYLGGYVFAEGLGNQPYRQSAMMSLQNLQNALNEVGHGEIKATFLNYIAVLNNRTKPSETEFLDEIKDEMITTLRFLQANKAPFVIEMFPMGEANWSNFDPSFAFPDNKSTVFIRDINGAVYTNIFEFTIDSFVWALNKHNFSDLKIIVGQVGWPTDGAEGATAANAERFFKHLLPFVASNKGTPMRPMTPIDTYVHALTDENRMSLTFTRHWGIYRSNGQPKFKIDLSGQGRDIFPTVARGIMRMPERWCIFSGDRSDLGKVRRELDYACNKSDCTSIAPGGSCSKLSFEQNISYAFNMHFQFQYQDEKACDFEGLGYVSVKDPSTDECVFPVEVIRGSQINFEQGKGFHDRPDCGIFLFLLISIMGTLIWA